MKDRQAGPLVPTQPNSTIDGLIEAAFAQIKQLGAAEESSRLFPNGLNSLELEIGSGPDEKSDLRISLKIAGTQVVAPTAATAHITAEVDVSMIGDVEATFNAEGHHIVALIMEQDLKRVSPRTMRKVQTILDNGGRSLAEAATFPDDIRMSQPQTKPFHFVDIPFQDGGPVNPPLPGPPNVISKIAEFSAALKQAGGSAQDRVDALSWLIHLFGDIHQPLHCIDHISELHPAGDRGGNSFKLKGKAKNLHSLWDSSVDFTNHENAALALAIVKEHPRTGLAADLKITDVEAWARSSFKLAKKYAYGPLHEDPASPPVPSSTYLNNAQKIGRQQAALAAYRLSSRLRETLG